jgi:UDP-N-acetyl-D-glucosamine dehydrogenase
MFASKDMPIAILGVGYVGLELIQVLSRYYRNIKGFDISEERARYVDNITNDNVTASHDPTILEGCDAYMICVPTPDDENGRPDESCLYAAKKLVETYAREGCVVILESSVCINDTRNIFGSLRDSGIFVAFSPERVDPGRTFPAAHSIQKLIGGLDIASLDEAFKYYEPVFDHLVPVSSVEVAEFCKLYENTFRLINIAFANQVADAAKKLGLDPEEVRKAVATKPFGLSGPFTSGLGAGGPCLPSNARHFLHTCDIPILEFAANACSERPEKKAEEYLEFAKANGIGKTLVYGLTFKKNVITTTESPALKFAQRLDKIANGVYFYDPIVDRRFIGDLHIVDDLDYIVKTVDNVIILVEHDHPDTDIVKSVKPLWNP